MVRRCKLWPIGKTYITSFLSFLLIEQESIVKTTLTISIFGRFLDSRRPIVQERFLQYRSKGLDDIMFRASSMPSQVRSQLFILAAERIEELEREVLEQLDRLVPQCRDKPLQADQALMVGLCIRRLSLYYRRIMLRYKQFEKGPSPSSRILTPTNSKMQFRARNPQNECPEHVRHDDPTLLSSLPSRSVAISSSLAHGKSRGCAPR